MSEPDNIENAATLRNDRSTVFVSRMFEIASNDLLKDKAFRKGESFSKQLSLVETSLALLKSNNMSDELRFTNSQFDKERPAKEFFNELEKQIIEQGLDEEALQKYKDSLQVLRNFSESLSKKNDSSILKVMLKRILDSQSPKKI